MKYAWDFTANSYSEFWRIDNVISSAKVVSGSIQTDLHEGKCQITNLTHVAKNATNVSTPVAAPQASQYVPAHLLSHFNISEGLVSDPFMDSDNTFYLWKNADNLSWMWLNSTTGDLVYI